MSPIWQSLPNTSFSIPISPPIKAALDRVPLDRLAATHVEPDIVTPAGD